MRAADPALAGLRRTVAGACARRRWLAGRGTWRAELDQRGHQAG
jgi:hypothetical protein